MTKTQIYEIRDNLGLTQEKFGELLGVHPMTVSKWERGELEPTPYQLKFLENFQKAAKEKQVDERVKAALVVGGIIAVIFLLLTLAKKGK